MLLLVGIVFAERPDVASQPLVQTAQPDSPLAAVTPDSMEAMAKPVSLNSLSAGQPALIPISSTNPVFNSQSAGSWFASQGAMVQPVNFVLPGN